MTLESTGVYISKEIAEWTTRGSIEKVMVALGMVTTRSKLMSKPPEDFCL